MLQGRDVLKKKSELRTGLREHIRLEEGSIEGANRMLRMSGCMRTRR
jgi:hypothetical protein